TEDLDTYDSNCDDISNAKAVLMANISNYGSNVISKVPPSVDFRDNEIHSDRNIILYSQYLKEQANVQEKANKEHNNESVTAELERYKERVKTFEQRIHLDLSSGDKIIDSQMDDMIKEKITLKELVESREQIFLNKSKKRNVYCKHSQFSKTVHMLTKLQSFYDNIYKQALGYQNLFHLKKAQQIKPTLYDGIVMSDKHVDMPVIDNEETLILEEESRSRMSEKEKDLEAIKQNISHKPIDYEKLNRLTEDFGKRFTPQQELSAEQAFWLRMSDPTRLKCSTSNCGSKLTYHKKNDKISQPPSRNMKNKVEANPRNVNKKNLVVEPIRNVDVKRSQLNANSKLICATCKKFMFHGVRYLCILDFVKNMNSRAKSAKKHKKQNIWKPTGLVFTKVGFKWKPTGTVRFGKDHIARIIGYGDYQLGNVTISRAYYVEELGHNLFSVGQFCDADLEVAFRKNTCFIRNLEDAQVDIGIFFGYVPAKSAFRIYNKRTHKIIETIHVTFDELTGLIPNIVSQQPFIPPNRDDWDHWFLPVFEEYFNPPIFTVFPVPIAAAPRSVDLVDSTVSTLIDQYAPSTSIPSTQEQEHSTNICKGFEESPKTPHFHDDPLNESPHEDLTSQGSSSNVLQIHTIFEHLGRWTKDHPIANIIRDPYRSVSIRKSLKTDAMWCYFDAFLTSVKPKNFKQAMIEPSWIDAMQE
nr:integrase, catalytic region, zinc finger, CCHC-type, peptidase aspartic, catalytic [Tanacetum cinerariifolium]